MKTYDDIPTISDQLLGLGLVALSGATVGSNLAAHAVYVCMK